MKLQSDCREKGFTLVEVLVALIIITLLVTCFLPVFATASLMVRIAGEENRMSSYAFMVMEYLRSYPGELKEGVTLADIDAEEVRKIPDGLTASLQVNRYGGESLYEVRVEVKSRVIKGKKLEFASIIAKH
ncbi:type II secretion system protein [Thermosyntropha lipolytica]|uniref:type II secretion system protein n=1 Tax=Thermosyntropha lipolytica TaxID=54294 RepID=UPI003BFA743E